MFQKMWRKLNERKISMKNINLLFAHTINTIIRIENSIEIKPIEFDSSFIDTNYIYKGSYVYPKK